MEHHRLASLMGQMMRFPRIMTLRLLSFGVDFCFEMEMEALVDLIYSYLRFSFECPDFFRYKQAYVHNLRLNQFKSLYSLELFAKTQVYQSQDHIFRIMLAFYLRHRYVQMKGFYRSCFQNFQIKYQLWPTFWMIGRNLKKIHHEQIINHYFVGQQCLPVDTPYHRYLQSYLLKL